MYKSGQNIENRGPHTLITGNTVLYEQVSISLQLGIELQCLTSGRSNARARG